MYVLFLMTDNVENQAIKKKSRINNESELNQLARKLCQICLLKKHPYHLAFLGGCGRVKHTLLS